MGICARCGHTQGTHDNGYGCLAGGIENPCTCGGFALEQEGRFSIQTFNDERYLYDAKTNTKRPWYYQLPEHDIRTIILLNFLADCMEKE